MNNVNNIIEKITKDNKKDNKSIYGILGIFLVLFIILMILYFVNKTSSYIFLGIMFLLVVLGCIGAILLKKNITDKKINALLKYQDEINNYCDELSDGIYATKNRILIIKSGFSSYKEILLENIIDSKESTITESSGESFINIPAITITTSDNKSIKIPSSDKLYNLLKMKMDNDNSEGKLIKSSIINDYYQYDDYQQGFIDLDLFNKKNCSLWIDSDVDVAYAEKVASIVKKLTKEDIEDAIESTLWFYNNDLLEYGYSNNSVPLRLTKEDVLNYLNLEEIYIRKVSDNSLCYILFFKTDMEIEHGISWMFKDNKVVFVGSGADESLDDINSKYNFAKGYHSEVLLTNEDYEKIERK